MSPFLYRDRLQWEGYSGVAKHDDVLVSLRSCPQFLAGLRLITIDFTPDVHVAMVQEFNQPHRDMSPTEVTQCRALLERMAIAASAASGNPAPAIGRQAGQLAESLGQCVDRYLGVAAIADDAINRGRACERSYDSLTQGAPK